MAKEDVVQEQVVVAQPAATPAATPAFEAVSLGASDMLPMYTPVIDPKQCPAGFVPMFFAGNMRVALKTGRCYVFAAGKPQFVNDEDRDEVAARGGAEYTGA